MIPQNKIQSQFDPLDIEMEHREWGLSKQQAQAFAWNELFQCYVLIYDDVLIMMPLI